MKGLSTKASLAFMLMCLFGCATIPNTSLVNLEGPIPDGHGIVIAETLSNSKYIPRAPTGWDELVFWRLEEESENSTFSIKRIPEYKTKYQYAGHLPQGKYALGMLYYSHNTDSYSEYVRALVPPVIGVFEVKPLEITDLGTIYYHPFKDPHWLDDTVPSYSITRNKNSNLNGFIKSKYPKVYNQLKLSSPTLGWIPDSFDEIRGNALELMKISEHVSNLYVFKENIFLAGNNGGLYINKNNKWSRKETNVGSKVSEIHELNGSFWGVSDNRELFLIDSNLRSISKSNFINNEPVKNILNINDNLFVVTYVDEIEINIYQINSEFSIAKLRSLKVAEMPSKVKYHALNVYSTSNYLNIVQHKNQYSYNVTTNNWSYTEIDGIFGAKYIENGTLFVMESDSWSGYKKMKFSLDDGKNWTKTSITTVDVYRDSQGTLYYLDKGHNLSFGAKEKILKRVPFYSSTDNGQTWQEASTLPRLCNGFITEQSTDDSFFIICESGDVLKSENKGKDWGYYFERLKVSSADFPKATVVNIE